ncbi:ABC transporter substrate-binding protein [Paraburkholderia acidisoli]|uniref:ABC transporter substrate-binding protein n=1 Tax=Paraburkholderia acidisoli TaxID=2571748 RepID=A0A7Z2GKS4_9BURK|nr:ABC transporter substrate-binding protein [Paraburkholderia acidisoli]QGZ63344.1 ABC transporter substrate-binding protein [Paraburkholderia acidisoli]
MAHRPGRWAIGIALTLAASWALSAQAQLKVGVVVSATGPGASLGIPEKNTVALFPKEIAGQRVEYLVLDDASDATSATKAMRKLVSEDDVDVVIGSTLSPNSISMSTVAAESATPLISIAGASSIVEPMDKQKAWVFKTPQHDSLMAEAIAQHIQKRGLKTLAVIAQGDAYGDGWVREITKAAAASNVKIVAVERYARTDSTVVGQVLKALGAHPDAMLVAGAGTPAVLPEKTLRERGYAGPIYQTHGIANNDVLRVGGKDLEGTVLPAGPVLVARQLPDSNPSKAVALGYIDRYEAAYGKDTVSTFGAHAWDAMLMLENAVPAALKTAKPGTPPFRAALRDALENVRNLTVTHGVMNLTSANHNGLDSRARVMVVVRDGRWKLLDQ